MSTIAARLVVGEAEARDVWELQPPGMGIGQRAASNGETGCKAWRGEIYIHGRAGIRPSMADGEMWAPALQEMRMGARPAELRDRNEARFARSAAPRGCSRLGRGVRAWTGPAEASAGAPAPNVSLRNSYPDLESPKLVPTTHSSLLLDNYLSRASLRVCANPESQFIHH